MGSVNENIDISYINKYPNFRDIYSYTINRAGMNCVNENFHIRRNSLYPYCNLHYVEAGNGTVMHRGKEFKVGEGQIFILNAFEPHIYRNSTGSPFHLKWLEFSGGESTLMVKRIIECHTPVISPPVSTRTLRYIHKILRFLQKDPQHYRFAISKMIYGMLLDLTIHPENVEKSCLNGIKSKLDIHPVLEYIDKNIGMALQVEMLANLVNFSTDHFSKVFRSVTGTSPIKYISKLKVVRAKELLAESNLKIEAIAQKLGYCDYSHFINKFKKAEGLTPAEYRKLIIKYINEQQTVNFQGNKET